MVFISGVLKIIQEGKSSKASDKLKAMIKTTATVYRNNTVLEVDIKDIVVGDIIKLAAGDMFSADGRIIEDEIPFDFSRRRMSVVLKDGENKI